MKNKIFIFLIISVFLICTFSITCFAAETLTFAANDSYVFADDLDFTMFEENTIEVYCPFVCDDVTYEGFYISYRGYYVLSYMDPHSDFNQDVYYQGDGWEDDIYRSITFIEDSSFDSPWAEFLASNEYESNFSVYGTIFDLISNHLFVGFMDDSFVKLSVTLLSATLTIAAFCVPFGVVYMIIKMILTAIDRSI